MRLSEEERDYFSMLPARFQCMKIVHSTVFDRRIELEILASRRTPRDLYCCELIRGREQVDSESWIAKILLPGDFR